MKKTQFMERERRKERNGMREYVEKMQIAFIFKGKKRQNVNVLTLGAENENVVNLSIKFGNIEWMGKKLFRI